MKNTFFVLMLALLVGVVSGCQKEFLDLAPADTISSQQLAENPTAAQAILNGIYANLRTFSIGDPGGFHVDYGLRGVMAGLDMMSEDNTMSAFHWYGFFYNYDGRVQTSSRTRVLWNTYYSQVAEANSVINAIEPGVTDPGARALLGQALALRALFTHNTARVYAHTYLGNEDAACIPLPDGLDFEGKPRATNREVYTQIVADLEAAVPLLDGFVRGTKQELDQPVAQMILARVYLDMGDWGKAAEAAAAARAGMVPMDAAEWLGGQSNLSLSECMWGADIDGESSTVYASFYSHFDNTNAGYAGLLGIYKLIDARLYSQIPDSDIRKQAFVDPVDGDPNYPELPAYANTKFRDPSFFEGDYIYMRTAEAYLIEAEARARDGQLTAAQDVLEELVTTRNPDFTAPATEAEFLDEIYFQRRIELWGEGHAWYDMKRWKKPLERDYDGSNHASFGLFNYPAEDNKMRFQIPEQEINNNPAISAGDQNPI